MQRTFWAWFWILLGALYFLLPLYGTLDFSLRKVRNVIGPQAYTDLIENPSFAETFGFSVMMALITILIGIILIVPTAYWVNLRLPQARPLIEFITLLPFVVPAIVLIFGLIRIYSRPPFSLLETDLGTNVLLGAGYLVISLPYMYRAVDTGLRAIDVRSLTEAAQSLGAGWGTILFRIILPNLRVALLSGAFLTFTTVIGEVTLTNFLKTAKTAFGPFMVNIGQTRPYESAAAAILSLALIWACVGLIQFIGRGSQQQGQIAGGR